MTPLMSARFTDLLSLAPRFQQVEDVGERRQEWVAHVTVDLPARAGERAALRLTPCVNRVMRLTKASVRPDVRDGRDGARRCRRAHDVETCSNNTVGSIVEIWRVYVT